MSIELIEEKLIELEKYLDELHEMILALAQEEVRKDRGKLHIAERIFQLIVDTMNDINIHILESKGKPYEGTESSFRMLGELEILPLDFAEKLAPVVGVRNIIVHRYEKLDADLFLQTLYGNSDDFKRYIVYISDFLAKQSK